MIYSPFFLLLWGLLLQDPGAEVRGVGVEGASAAASRCRLHRSALDLHVRLLSASSCGSRAHSLLDLSSHGHEGLLHVGSILSASFQERNAKGICKFLEINQAVLSVRTLEKWTIASLCTYRLCSKTQWAAFVGRNLKHTLDPHCTLVISGRKFLSLVLITRNLWPQLASGNAPHCC